jgi:hypothetical protein
VLVAILGFTHATLADWQTGRLASFRLVAQYKRWVHSRLSPAELRELEVVDDMAQRLLAHMDRSADAIAMAHVHGATSQSVQAHLAVLLKDELGFDEEVVLTPQEGLVTQSRPDSSSSSIHSAASSLRSTWRNDHEQS